MSDYMYLTFTSSDSSNFKRLYIDRIIPVYTYTFESPLEDFLLNIIQQSKWVLIFKRSDIDGLLDSELKRYINKKTKPINPEILKLLRITQI